jgi:hypothetical protein
VKKTRMEHENFVGLVDRLLAVPHSEIKARMDAEKQAKKRKKSKKSSA